MWAACGSIRVELRSGCHLLLNHITTTHCNFSAPLYAGKICELITGVVGSFFERLRDESFVSCASRTHAIERVPLSPF
jgi:hypothetical protein